MLLLAIVITILLIIGAAAILLLPNYAKRNEERDFISGIYNTVYSIARDKDFYVINDVAIEIDTKIIHFNHILFGDKYIYCIGDSYQNGALSGKFLDQQWLKYSLKGDVSYIKNPMLLHQTRLRYLKSALNAEDLLVGICVVNDSCLLDDVVDAPEEVVIINEKDLRSYVNLRERENISLIDPIQLDSLVHIIYNKNNQTKENLLKQQQ